MSRQLHPGLALRSGSLLLVLGLSLAACGDDDAGGGSGGASGQGGDAATATTTDAASTGAGGDASSSTGAGASAACPYPEGVETSPQPTTVTQVIGVVLDADGEPLAGAEVQVCGKDLCLYGDTDGDGSFVVVNDSDQELDTPVVKAGDGIALAKLGFALPAADEEVEARTIALADSGTAMVAGAVAEADGVTLTLADDGAVALNLLDFGDPGEDSFRAAVFPLDLVDIVAPGEGFDMVVALGPYETRFCPPAQLTVPNDAELPAGSAVDIYLYGLQIGDSFVPYGTWDKIADGVVSDDGSTISTDAEAIPVLGPIGIRAVE